MFRPIDDDRTRRWVAMRKLPVAQPVDTAIVALLNTYGGVYWPMQESSGSVAFAWNTALAEGRNICLNGTFASDSVWVKGANWTISGGVATHTPGTASIIDQNLVGYLRAGASYRVSGTATCAAGSLQVVLGGTAAGLITSTGAFTFDVICGAANTRLQFSSNSAHDGTIDNISLTRLNIAANDPNFNGTHTDVTPGQSAGKLGLAASYAAATSQSLIFSPELNSVFNPLAGTVIIFAQVSGAGVWTDGVGRQLFTIYVDASNRIYIYKNSSNQLSGLVGIGGFKAVPISVTPTGVFMGAVTWNMSLDTAIFYYNGVAQGSPMTGFGTWAGNLNSGSCNIGCFAASSSPWSGLLTRAVLLRGAATAAEMLRLAQIAGAA